jgi:lysophospholipase L1-like esterase
MKTNISILIALSIIQFNSISLAQYKIPENIKRILFLGNSITYSGQYVSYVEAYLTIHYPGKQYEIINAGLPSETVSGLSENGHAGGRFPRPDLHERLDRVMDQIKPDLVFACYGMNDGIYLPFDDARFQKFRDGINWMHEEVKKYGASIVHITPPVFDERKGKEYANVLDIYSDWLISCRYTAKWDVIDIHWPMKKYIEDRRLTDSLYVFAKDGVHPNETGHWVMAKQILLFLGEKSVSDAEDAKSAINLYPNAETILKLVKDREDIMKDAWLTSTGHKRPEMKIGLQLNEAKLEAVEIDKQISSLLKKN